MEAVRPVQPPPVELVPVPLTGEGRLYGRVVTRRGDEHVGFIRWDRNEGSWADFLDADKDDGATRSGIRFGVLAMLAATGSFGWLGFLCGFACLNGPVDGC